MSPFSRGGNLHARSRLVGSSLSEEKWGLLVVYRYSPGPADPNYSQTSLYGHLIITDSLLSPWGNKALTFSLNSTRLVRTLSMAPQCPY